MLEAVLKYLADIRPLAPLMAASFADVNMRSTFECSRNDVISNIGVLLAAAGVWGSGRSWPDLVVGLIVAALF